MAAHGCPSLNSIDKSYLSDMHWKVCIIWPYFPPRQSTHTNKLYAYNQYLFMAFLSETGRQTAETLYRLLQCSETIVSTSLFPTKVLIWSKFAKRILFGDWNSLCSSQILQYVSLPGPLYCAIWDKHGKFQHLLNEIPCDPFDLNLINRCSSSLAPVLNVIYIS